MRVEWRGCMVESLAGRDRGSYCVVLYEEGDFLWIADGRKHALEAPKKKKRKHLRLISGKDGQPLRLDESCFTNRRVRVWLRENAGRVQI